MNMYRVSKITPWGSCILEKDPNAVAPTSEDLKKSSAEASLMMAKYLDDTGRGHTW